MSFIKRLIPNNIKQEGKYFLQYLLGIPYNRAGVPMEIVEWLPNDKPITFIDIGASDGGFSAALAQFYTIKRGLLIEALETRLPLLKTKFDSNIYTILNVAVSDLEGETDFYISKDFDYISSLLNLRPDFNLLSNLKLSEPVKTTVKTQTLDNIVLSNFPEIIDLLKIDVQGAEHLVLSKGVETLKKTRLVYTEYSWKPMYEGSSVLFDLFNIMDKNNFRLVDISKGFRDTKGELLQGDALFINNALN